MSQNKPAARLILDLPAHSSAADALTTLGWKPLLRRRKEHHAQCYSTLKSLLNERIFEMTYFTGHVQRHCLLLNVACPK